MDKFDHKRAEAQRKLEEELAKIDEAEKAHLRKVIKPIASKFAALIAEEIEKFGESNLSDVEDYKFSKAHAREQLRKFVHGEFASQNDGNVDK